MLLFMKVRMQQQRGLMGIGWLETLHKFGCLTCH